MIWPARVNGTAIADRDIAAAIAEFADSRKIGRREAYELTLSQVTGDRSDAASWVEALASVVAAETPGQDRMVEEYIRHNPPSRAALTSSGDTHVALTSDADVDAEVSRIVQANAQTRRPVLDGSRPARQTPCQTVAMSRQHERLYDDDLGGSISQRAADAEVIRLSRSAGRGIIDPAALAQTGAPDRVDSFDSGAPSVSDLDGQVDLYSESPDSADFGPEAAAEYAAMPAAVHAEVQSHLDAAADADDVATKTLHLMQAGAAAHRAPSHHLRRELAARVQAVTRAAASYVPDSEEAEAQTAGDVDAEVTRYAELLNVQNGNKSTPPKSVARRNQEQIASRPGYSNRGAAGYGENPIRQ